jgi:hypothetical protein
MKLELLKNGESQNSPSISVTEMFPLNTSKPQFDSDLKRDPKKKNNSKAAESSSPKIIIGKTKKILKRGSKNYHIFYKLRYKKLRALHSRWNPKQISSLIKLEWEKEKLNDKKTKRTLDRSEPQRVGKVLSGYQFYRKYRNFSSK